MPHPAPAHNSGRPSSHSGPPAPVPASATNGVHKSAPPSSRPDHHMSDPSYPSPAPAGPAYPDVCGLSPEAGRCRAIIRSWYYDEASGTCKVFSYGGCGGNANRFNSEEECQQACSPKAGTHSGLSEEKQVTRNVKISRLPVLPVEVQIIY